VRRGLSTLGLLRHKARTALVIDGETADFHFYLLASFFDHCSILSKHLVLVKAGAGAARVAVSIRCGTTPGRISRRNRASMVKPP